MHVKKRSLIYSTTINEASPTNDAFPLSDSLIIKLSGRLQALDEGDLLITSTTTADSGKYTCIRANDAGNVSGEAYLTVLGTVSLDNFYNNLLM